MKVLVIQPKVGMGDMVIYLPYIHAISRKYQSRVSLLVKENSRAGELLLDEMVSHKFGLSDINNGIELMKKGQCLRILIDMDLV